LPAWSIVSDQEAGDVTLRIDPCIVDDLGLLEPNHAQYVQALHEAEAAGNPVRAHAARIELHVFEALFCEQVEEAQP